ncbi:MAG: AI-2E family transporter [Anaerolineae bacterium]|nr:AI-2E family transporter [Anaerolineae bacterium]
MQNETVAKPDNPRPRWDTTTKVMVSVFLIVLFGLAVYLFRIVFIPLIIGGIVAYLLQPVVRRIQRLTRLPHKISTALLYLTLLAIIILLGIALTPSLATQAKALVNELTIFISKVEEQGSAEITLLGFTLSAQSLIDEITSVIRDFLLSTEAITLLPDVAETALLLVFTLLISFYMTRDAEQIVEWVQRLSPPQYHVHMRAILSEIDQMWAAFFRGQVILALVVTLIITSLCILLGLPQPLLLGVLAGILEFLPSLGHTIWTITAVILALVTGSTWLPISNHVVFALLVAGVHLVFTQVDLNYLIPRIIGEQVHLHPMVVIVGIIIGAKVGGVLGIAIAAPTIATLRILGRYIYALLFDIDPYPSPDETEPSQSGESATTVQSETESETA